MLLSPKRRDASIVPMAGARRALRHEGSRPQPAGADECKGEVGVVPVGARPMSWRTIAFL
jgi:hypothetical protein